MSKKTTVSLVLRLELEASAFSDRKDPIAAAHKALKSRLYGNGFVLSDEFIEGSYHTIEDAADE